MAEIKFECPNCGQHIVTDEEYAGINCECPTCSQPLTIPSVETINMEIGQQQCAEDVSQSMETTRYRMINGKVYRSQKEFDKAIKELSSGLCKIIKVEYDKGNYILFSLKRPGRYEICYFTNEQQHLLHYYIPQKYIATILKNCLTSNDFANIPSSVDQIENEIQFYSYKSSYVRKKSSNFDWKQFFSMDNNNLGCGGVIILLLLALFFLYLLYGGGGSGASSSSYSSSTSSSSSNAGGYQCKGCTAWSPSPFGSGGYCSRCAEKGAKAYLERFAERAIKEETGLDAHVRMEKNNGKYEFKVSY
jgi:hypothetical protein